HFQRTSGEDAYARWLQDVSDHDVSSSSRWLSAPLILATVPGVSTSSVAVFTPASRVPVVRYAGRIHPLTEHDQLRDPVLQDLQVDPRRIAEPEHAMRDGRAHDRPLAASWSLTTLNNLTSIATESGVRRACWRPHPA